MAEKDEEMGQGLGYLRVHEWSPKQGSQGVAMQTRTGPANLPKCIYCRWLRTPCLTSSTASDVEACEASESQRSCGRALGLRCCSEDNPLLDKDLSRIE
mmetsp:Transcript_42664/g.69532  ORF Transcript_42664/g.69532 Transcript_42664/m.69532 type:complete len:99 (+) Transcript_42664:1335-1631(+)